MGQFCNFVALLVSVFVASGTALAVPTYNIVPLGLDDLEHTRNDGYKSSYALYSTNLNDAGQVFGFSDRYNGGSADLGQSVWFYNGTTTNKVGLTGSEHTRVDGYKHSQTENVYDATPLNQGGQLYGYSDRYNGGTASLGRSAWLYDGLSTIDIGLIGSAHTRNDGYKYSNASELNESGMVMGTSFRFSGNLSRGSSAWLYDGASTINIGFTGAEHTRSDGYKSSSASGLNEAGHVAGTSERYVGSIHVSLPGRSAWLYDGATTVDIGLTDNEHTSYLGYRHSSTGQLNEAGQVTGSSRRFYDGSASASLSETAWVYDGATTTAIGLTDIEHTRDNGYKLSAARGLNEAGQVHGTSERYNGGSTFLGQSAWVYDGATTVHIGLTGPEHTRNDGYKTSSYFLTAQRPLNEAGHVIGSSQRFEGGSTGLGTSAWIYDGTTTVHIGLTDSEHTSSDGFKVSQVTEMNEAGQVIGSSYLRGNPGLGGRSVWLYDGATTINVGLTDTEHTRNDGFRFSIPHQLNNAGQVAGYSSRYDGSTGLGEDAWLYDPALNQSIALNLSTRSDGYASSSVTYLGEDGLVLGTYQLYDAFDNSVGTRAFYFTIADGLHDLGSLVDGGLSNSGWEYLSGAVRTANSRGQILGSGKLTSQTGGGMAYLLTPVPEPSPVSFTLMILLGTLAVRRSLRPRR